MNSNLEDIKLVNNGTQLSLHQDLKESLLDCRFKTSDQDVPDLDYSAQNQVQAKLNYFGKMDLYKALMTFHLIVFSIGSVIPLDDKISLSQKVDLIMALWALVQFKMAFSGTQERKLAEIERALRLMKFYLVLMGVSMLSKFFKRTTRRWRDKAERYEFSFDSEIVVEMVFKMIMHGTFNILPIIKISKMIQEKGGMQIENSPREFNSWRFVGFKYWVLIWLSWTLLDLVVFMRRDKHFKRLNRMGDDFSLLVLIMSKLIFCAIKCGFLYLLFEGIRKKQLSKVQTAIRLIKLGIVAQVLFSAFKAMKWDEEYQRGDEWIPMGPFGTFLLISLFDVFVSYVVFLYGATKVREILKAQRDAKQTL